MDTPDLVEVYRGGGGPMRADFLKNALESDGIPAMVHSDSAVAAHPLTVGPMGEFSILVRQEDVPRAWEVLEPLVSEPEPGALEDDEDDDSPQPSVFFKKRRKVSPEELKGAGVLWLICGALLMIIWRDIGFLIGLGFFVIGAWVLIRHKKRS